MPGRTKIALAALLAPLALVPAAFALLPSLTEEPVLTGPRNESQPSVARAKGVDVLLWAKSRAGHPNSSDVYLRRGTGRVLKLNRKGLGYGGGIEPPFVVYQQVVDGKSDLKLYRMDTRKRVALPAGVNTKHWEWRPKISGRWLLFGRSSVTSQREQIILFNRKTKAKRSLASIWNRNFSLVPGQISGNWVTWTLCTPVCDSFLYNISTRSKTKLQKPAGPGHVNIWTAGVTKAGVVYVGRGPDGCGNSVQLVRYRGAGDPSTGTVLLSLPDGKDFNGTFVRAKNDGSVDIYYARVTCGTHQTWDVYRANDPAPPR